MNTKFFSTLNEFANESSGYNTYSSRVKRYSHIEDIPGGGVALEKYIELNTKTGTPEEYEELVRRLSNGTFILVYDSEGEDTDGDYYNPPESKDYSWDVVIERPNGEIEELAQYFDEYTMREFIDEEDNDYYDSRGGDYENYLEGLRDR